MTVAELRELLRDYPEDAEVLVTGFWEAIEPLERIEDGEGSRVVLLSEHA